MKEKENKVILFTIFDSIISRVNFCLMCYFFRKLGLEIGKNGLNFFDPTRKYPIQTQFFWPEAKMGWLITRSVFFAGQLNPTCDPNHFLKLFFG